MDPRPILYDELADWWPLLSAPSEYEPFVEHYATVLKAHSTSPPRTVLELGSGGGNNALHLKRTFDLTLVDLSPRMLEVSEVLNPECAHHVGDMRSIRLDAQFDCVFVQDAVSYMTTRDDLRRAIQTAFLHCRPGGVALFAPDFVRETFTPYTDCGGHDGDGRAMRYLSWTWDPDPEDSTFITDFAYLLRERDGDPQVRRDRHVEGLFPSREWMDLIQAVGFDPTELDYLHEEAPVGTKIFVGVKPPAPEADA